MDVGLQFKPKIEGITPLRQKHQPFSSKGTESSQWTPRRPLVWRWYHQKSLFWRRGIHLKIATCRNPWCYLPLSEVQQKRILIQNSNTPISREMTTGCTCFRHMTWMWVWTGERICFLFSVPLSLLWLLLLGECLHPTCLYSILHAIFPRELAWIYMKWPVSIVWLRICSSNWFCPQQALVSSYSCITCSCWLMLPIRRILRWGNELRNPPGKGRGVKLRLTKEIKNKQTLTGKMWEVGDWMTKNVCLIYGNCSRSICHHWNEKASLFTPCWKSADYAISLNISVFQAVIPGTD